VAVEVTYDLLDISGSHADGGIGCPIPGHDVGALRANFPSRHVSISRLRAFHRRHRQ
jgi:hypothetical protein